LAGARDGRLMTEGPERSSTRTDDAGRAVCIDIGRM
jgi:hypothetical protein